MIRRGKGAVQALLFCKSKCDDIFYVRKQIRKNFNIIAIWILSILMGRECPIEWEVLQNVCDIVSFTSRWKT